MFSYPDRGSQEGGERSDLPLASCIQALLECRIIIRKPLPHAEVAGSQGKALLLAYSGGLDSHVLLHSLWQLRELYPSLSIKAVHVHHGLSANADFWLAHCSRICNQLQIDFVAKRVNSKPKPGESIEAWARKARYNILESLLSKNDILLTAHTQNDQAETLLLQLLRGAGPKGLASMAYQQSFGNGHHFRPFLNLTRQELKKYALHYQLSWIEDDSNTDLRFDRNFLRHQILPLLQQRWPAAVENIARSAGHCAEAASLLNELAQIDLENNQPQDQLDLAILRKLKPTRQRNLLRYWFDLRKCGQPNSAKLYRIQEEMICGRVDSQPQISWGQWILRRFKDRLRLIQATALNELPIIPWDLSTPLLLPGNLGQLVACKNQKGGLSTHLDPQKISIRFRRGGERCQLTYKNHAALKKLFQQWQTPQWERGQIPLLYYNEDLAAVIGYCVCAPFAANKEELGWTIQQLK
ncbi:MAG: tRNA lysidine(34) synthetase TilS [Proteobacteria bacterium]|nr:tRNA lysidine(34) synthetase TilS [Pseudomonadota bacterium]